MNMQEAHTILIAALVAAVVSVSSMALFWHTFQTKSAVGVCEKYGWRLEGSGTYQHKHCFDPKTHTMYLPPEIDP